MPFNYKSKHDLEDRLRFGEINETCCKMLANFWPILATRLPGILRDIYVRLHSVPHLSNLLGTHAPRLEQAQMQHWERLLSGQFDQNYIESVRAIGIVHHRIGLETRWYMGGYNFVRNRVVQVAIEAYAAMPEQRDMTIAAINSAVTLDMDIALSVYWHAYTQGATAAAQAAQQVAELSTQAKSRFLAHMSHEMRTPMNAVLGMLELILKEAAADRQSQLAQTAHSAGMMLMDLIGNILDISKIEANGLQLDAVALNLEDLVTDVTTLLGFQADQKGIALRTALPALPVPALMGDPLKLRQILMNIIGNAIKFTERGAVAVALDVPAPEPTDAAAGRLRVRITVRDSGIGIAADKLQSVFAPFAQADQSVTRRFGGSGLGLPIAAGLAEAMGGQITVTSTPGVGSTFVITLALPLATEMPRGAAERAAEEMAPPEGATVRVLVADDSAVGRMVAGELLKLCHCQVDFAENGQQAAARAAFNDYDIVFMDLQMPVMDGFAATTKIRVAEAQARSERRTPIIALTANAVPEELDRGITSGMDDVLTKPVGEASFRTALRRWVPGYP